ncbi:DNA-directed RNA polymerase subunit delta [Alkalicoccobacillus porphyridii]|uniref:Probable DNA-directed RNA polymerase subunit delta n=1 Tax=Alkalicoccobacillus porphyridii TaxID=2597270 RepID=A0A553ZU04_9BACI|nr:DNA-directed RNA polymerase subunit delta [Alkalicoccobacillus porphyridii]TSB44959.1 DNA-directed RNA polymerase subunit delta [Alkalicoccobacillus porphyridii]
MNLSTLSADEIQEMSMIEITFALMQEKNQPIEYYELVNQIAEIKGLSKEDVNNRISFLYTDLNTDGRFITLGENRWGLKSWYPIDQIEEPVPAAAPKKKKKKSADEDDDDLDLVDDNELDDSEEDEFEDLADELDEISSEEDSSEEDYDEKDLDGFDDDDDEEEDEDDDSFDDEEEEDR